MLVCTLDFTVLENVIGVDDEGKGHFLCVVFDDDDEGHENYFS
jgi:hypothetical protein